MDKPDFTKLNLTGLVNIYNDFAKELRETHGIVKNRKAFRDKASGQAACEAAWDEIQQAQRASTEGKEVMTEETTAADASTIAEAPKTARKPRAKKAEVTTKKANGKKAAAPKKEKTEAKGHRGRAPKYADNAKLKVLIKENPGREGTNSQAYFDLIKSSKTVGDYVAAGGDRKYLDWYVGRELVSVT